MVRVDFDRPREIVIKALGEDNQDCPALVLGDPARAAEFNLPVREAEGKTFMTDEKTILLYLSLAYGVSRSAY